MANCFKGIVSLRGCNIPEIQGAVYSLNSLPGISLKAFGQVANNEQGDWRGVWDDINERAGARLHNEILSRLSTRYKILRVKRTLDTKGYDTTAAAAANTEKGILVRCDWFDTDNWQLSPFQTVNVQSVRFYYDNTSVATSVTINFNEVSMNGDTFTTVDTLHSITVQFADLTAGWNEIVINQQFNVANLAIVFNSNNINTVTYDSDEINNIWGNCCYTCFNTECGQIKGANGGNSVTDITGLQAVITIGCSYDAAICSNKLLFSQAYWYTLGAEFMSERIYSDRVNFLTTVKRDDAEKLRDAYSADADKYLQNALDGLTFECDICLECNSMVSTFTQTP